MLFVCISSIECVLCVYILYRMCSIDCGLCALLSTECVLCVYILYRMCSIECGLCALLSIECVLCVYFIYRMCSARRTRSDTDVREDVFQWHLAQASAAAIYGVYRAVLPPLSPALAMQVLCMAPFSTVHAAAGR